MFSTPKAAGGSGGPPDDDDLDGEDGEDDEEGEESEQEVDDEEGDYLGDPDSPGPRVPKRAGNGSSRQAGNGDWGGSLASSSHEAPSGGLSGLEAIFTALFKSQNQGRSDMFRLGQVSWHLTIGRRGCSKISLRPLTSLTHRTSFDGSVSAGIPRSASPIWPTHIHSRSSISASRPP